MWPQEIDIDFDFDIDCDIDLEFHLDLEFTFNIDFERIEEKITSKTKAIMVVHIGAFVSLLAGYLYA